MNCSFKKIKNKQANKKQPSKEQPRTAAKLGDTSLASSSQMEGKLAVRQQFGVGVGVGMRQSLPSLGNQKEARVYSNHETVRSRQRMQLASFFPLATLRSHPAERFQVPDLRRPCQRESGRPWGSPGGCIPEWCVTRLTDVKLCRDNSLPRQPTNPLPTGFLCVAHTGFSCARPLFARLPVRRRFTHCR